MTPLVKTQRGELIPFKDYPQAFHPERLWVIAKAGNVIGATIVDVGCGAHKTFTRSIGVDIRPGTDYQCSLEELPFLNGSIHIVIARHVLEHVLNPVRALRECWRVLSPDGRMLVILPDHEVVDTMQPALSAGCHLHAYSQESFRDLIETIGIFEIDTLEIVLSDWSFGAVLRPIKANDAPTQTSTVESA